MASLNLSFLNPYSVPFLQSCWDKVTVWVWESGHMVLWNVYSVPLRVLIAFISWHTCHYSLLTGFHCSWLFLNVISSLLVCPGEHHSCHCQSGHHLQERTPQVQNQDHEWARQQRGPDLPVPCWRRDRVQDQHSNERESRASCLFTQSCLPFPLATDSSVADMKAKILWKIPSKNVKV